MSWTSITMASSLPTVRELWGSKSLMLLQSSMVILVLASLSNRGASQKNCSLDFDSPVVQSSPGCRGGTWGGFLSESCCGDSFDRYLYALGMRAKESGKIFLNATEQKNCLLLMQNSFGGISGCGIDRLTSGKGGCSEFTVGDVLNKLGNQVRALGSNCELSDDGVGAGMTCDLCSRRWDATCGSYAIGPASVNTSADVCKFAVLVTLTSTTTTITDEKWAFRIFKCLREHLGDTWNGQSRSRKYILNAGDGQSKGIHNIWKSLGIWLLIGGFVCLVTVILFALWIWMKRRTKSDKSDLPQEKDVSKESLLEQSGCQKIPVKEIYAATNDLSALNFIGQGMAGIVYKGVLPNGCDVAIKHIVKDGYVETFLREVTSLSHVRHPNLVTLIGYCEEEEYFLVYEFCSNGNLAEWLFEDDKKLSWIQRLEIALGSACGLWFLHTFEEGCIVHRDIKPTNILLGTDFEAKLSDFGLSKVMEGGVSHVFSEVRGTFGYVDPEYRQNHCVNSAGDVYSFGIVLLQILSGKRALNLNVKGPLLLNKMAKHLMRAGNISEFADPKLNGEYSVEAFVLTLQVALSCTGDKQGRPSMEQVVTRLEDVLDISRSHLGGLSAASITVGSPSG